MVQKIKINRNSSINKIPIPALGRRNFRNGDDLAALHVEDGFRKSNLTIRTHIEPDECDEVSKVFSGFAIAVPGTPPDGINLEVFNSLRGVSRVSYFLPANMHGILTLFDFTGRLVESKRVLGSGEAVFISDLSAGVYLVQLETGGQIDEEGCSSEIVPLVDLRTVNLQVLSSRPLP